MSLDGTIDGPLHKSKAFLCILQINLKLSSVCRPQTGRVQPGTKLDGRAKNTEAQRRETEVRASRALGRAFLLLDKCFKTEAPSPQALPPSSGCWSAGRWDSPAHSERSPTPTARRNRASHPRPACLPGTARHPQKGRAPGSVLRPPELPNPPPRASLKSRFPRAPAGKEATGRGAARHSPAQEACSRLQLERRRRRPCCGAAAAAAPSRNSALPSPSRSAPPAPKSATPLEKVRLRLRNAKRGFAAPAPCSVSAPPPSESAAPARCPPGQWWRGAGRAQVAARRRGQRPSSARSPPAARPQRACPGSSASHPGGSGRVPRQARGGLSRTTGVGAG
ncbi:skin secretory protein xP2-like [Choloepus didactylus]|uniref:skin secretory protein xP2-like n=1 Tax=Choloepus didactylus TaxID=27675 RepID=UPI00189CBE33|nr:skin secretory protein xP2-like [Choloepus didactylus]